MKNVTVTLDHETARWARIEAARRGMSLSGFLRALLRERMVADASYAESMDRYLSRRPNELGGRLPTREETHSRADPR
jgi:hypothetical protein